MPTRHLSVHSESWPLAVAFTISRGSKTHADVVVVAITEDGVTGRGECVPYSRYGESTAGVEAAIRAQIEAVCAGMTREELQRVMPAGAARNAVDCAMWDLHAKQLGTDLGTLAGIGALVPVQTALTIGLATPAEMAAQAAQVGEHRLLKLKLGRDGDAQRIQAVRAARPDARLIVDANEGWTAGSLVKLLSACKSADVELVEQPLPAGNDAVLARVERLVPVCADESVHDRHDLDALLDRYDAVNIKLDKTGGLTEALAVAERARQLDLRVMVGCMVCTSLAIMPALVVAQSAHVVDLDGPLLLARDRADGLTYDGDLLRPPQHSPAG